MKTVLVHPERCVGCMQCMPACATAHSRAKSLFLATLEEPRPQPRIHLGAGPARRRVPQPLPALRPGPLHAGLPGRRHQARRVHQHGPHRPGPLHQLRLLRHGLPLRRHSLSSGFCCTAQKDGGGKVRQLPGTSGTGPRSGLRGNLHGREHSPSKNRPRPFAGKPNG